MSSPSFFLLLLLLLQFRVVWSDGSEEEEERRGARGVGGKSDDETGHSSIEREIGKQQKAEKRNGRKRDTRSVFREQKERNVNTSVCSL